MITLSQCLDDTGLLIPITWVYNNIWEKNAGRGAGKMGVRRASIGWMVLAGALATLPFRPVSAQDVDLGPTFENQIEIAGKQVPLPEGLWQMTGIGHTPRRDDRAEPFGAIVNVVLVQVERSTVTALAVINTNAVEVDNGWRFSAECERSDLYMADLTGHSLDGNCLFVNHVLTTTDFDSSKAWRRTLETVQRDSLVLPRTWISAGFSVASRTDFVDVRYYFNPDARGLPKASAVSWTDSPWHRDRVGAYPAHAAFVEQVKTWGTRQRHYVDRGLRGHLQTDHPLPLPWTMGDDTFPPGLAARMLKLRAMHDQGVLTDEDYRKQTDLILDAGRAKPNDDNPAWVRALQKTISWRMIASADTMLLGYLVTGDVMAAGSIAFLEVVSKMAAYFGHEMVWEAIDAQHKAIANPIMLETAGTDCDRYGETITGTVAPWLVGWLPQTGILKSAEAAPTGRDAPPLVEASAVRYEPEYRQPTLQRLPPPAPSWRWWPRLW